MKKNILEEIALISEIGFLIVISTLAGLFFGFFLDNKFKTKAIFTIIFLLFGIIGGLLGAYRIIMQEGKIGGDKENNKRGL